MKLRRMVKQNKAFCTIGIGRVTLLVRLVCNFLYCILAVFAVYLFILYFHFELCVQLFTVSSVWVSL